MSQKNNILEELTQLNSSLAGSGPVNPYVVPAGYFDELVPQVLRKIRVMESGAQDEITELSPLLAGLKKQMPYSVPDGYFERQVIPSSSPAKIVSMNPRRWFRYVAAVIVVGLLVLSGLVIWRNNDVEKMGIARFEKKLSREIDKMTDVELTNFLEQTDPILIRDQTVNSNPSNDVKELLEDIPESDLKEFIEETSVLDAEEMLMN